MATFMGDACVAVGEFTDNNGNVKRRYAKVGGWFQNDRGEISVKFELIPAVFDPKGGFWVSLFHRQDNQNGGGQQGGQRQPAQQGSPRPAPQQGGQRQPAPRQQTDADYGEVPF